jgi:hypothetical protein
MREVHQAMPSIFSLPEDLGAIEITDILETCFQKLVNFPKWQPFAVSESANCAARPYEIIAIHKNRQGIPR